MSRVVLLPGPPASRRPLWAGCQGHRAGQSSEVRAQLCQLAGHWSLGGRRHLSSAASSPVRGELVAPIPGALWVSLGTPGGWSPCLAQSALTANIALFHGGNSAQPWPELRSPHSHGPGALLGLVLRFGVSASWKWTRPS